MLLRLLLAAPAAARWRGRLRALLGAIGPQLVHSNGFKLHLAGALALPPGARLVWHVHDYPGARRLMRRAMRRLAPRAAAAIAVSRSVADDLRASCGPGLRIEVVHNGVDLEHFSPAGPRLDLDARAGLPPVAPGMVRVGLVATLGVWKGHEHFLRALARLPAGAGIRGYVVGGGIYATAGSQVDPAGLRRLAAELGVEVGFTGEVEDPAAAMRALDVVVHASSQPEPFGLVIAEALACGRATVLSAAGGAAELALEGHEALSFPPGRVDRLAAALARLVADPALRARLGAAGRARAERDYDRRRVATQAAALYLSLVATG